MRRRSLFLSMCACVMWACSPSAPTQLIVVVDTDLHIPAEIDHLTIDVSGPDHMQHRQAHALDGHEMLPFTLTVVPNGEALGPIDITADASLHGTSVVARSARVTLVRGETRQVLLHLARRCLGVTCASGQTCADHGCAPIDATPLYPWSGTPSRLGQDAGSAIDGGHDAGPVDAGMMRDSGRDAASLDPDGGTDCTTTGCDDHNPCTDDVCNGMRLCVHTPLDIACDDGMFCNGLDHCGSGSCSLHGGNPCVGTTLCDEIHHVCTGCTNDASCPAAMMGGFGACGGFADACTNTGMQSQIVRTFHCMGTTCMPTDTTSTQPCFRDTTGTACAPTTCTSFGACTGTDTCGTSGTASRTCSDFTCGGGTCRSAMRPDTTSCSRSTDGTPCGSDSCGGWSACSGFSEPCGTTGSQSRSCTSPLCAGGTCGGSSSRTETQACSRGTDGVSCGSTHCDGFGGCDFGGDPCRTDGAMGRLCHDPVCQGGGCGETTRTELQACSRSTDGTGCGAAECGSFDCTGGLGEYQCDQDGFTQASCRNRVCGGGACGYSGYYTMTGGACTSSTDGQSCYAGGCGSDYCWGGSCNYGGC